MRTPLGLALVGLVAGLVLLGHVGRLAFALATQVFVVLAVWVIVAVLFAGPAAASQGEASAGPLLSDAAIGPLMLAVPLGMALATGVEAPSNAVAQLPQLINRARGQFGRWTLWSMIGIVGMLAGSGVLKALATLGRDGEGLVPSYFGRINRFLVPEWGVTVVLVAAAILVAAGGREQRLVPFYAVAVFASFLAATIGCARLSYRDRRWLSLALNLLGALLVGLVLAINATRLDGAIALLVSAVVAAYLWRVWVSRGRPTGVAGAGSQ